MAWLQNLAGRAEDLLNKIDQNAATVLNEATSKINEVKENSQQEFINEVFINKEKENGKSKSSNSSYTTSHRNSSFQNSPKKEHSPVLETRNVFIDSDIPTTINEPLKQTNSSIVDDSAIDESVKSSVKSDKMSSSSSIHNSFILAEETQLLHERIAKLELENQDLNKQLLNMQHLYSDLRNENSNLRFQIERANEQVAEAQIEKDQYIARAQRILQEKERLISLKQQNNSDENVENIFTTYNEELKRELEFQQNKSEELSQRNSQLLKEIQSLQMQHQIIQNGLQSTNQSLEQTLANEKKIRAIAEEDCLQKTNEVYKAYQEINFLQQLLKTKTNEIMSLQEALKTKNNVVVNEDIESRIKSLTQTLMLKQNNLETVTTERNALRLQIEKLENEYKKNLAQINRTQAKIINITEPDDSIPVPKFMRVSPFDAGVTRRVKHAYSTLDAVSIRTGIFLRRYPVARVFVFCYMVLLHIWVLVILFLYAPSNR
ncbi:golgin-84 isoform X2 [Diorhabda carinulata]|uniref:golgin-84 isoform X2 n=1 Tax=Diorhabda carinulata TaxID=1163345 RepID=UPI00259FFC2B|nr:golgin-84 isoform X2 [Diorhabda carinulata]